ncbi:type II secretion system protein F, partial [Achromatium sp. WMS3]
MASTKSKNKSPPKPKTAKLATFKWEGTDRTGKKASGETRAVSVNAAKSALRSQGIKPTKVRKEATPLFSGGKKAITTSDISVFSRQLATMMQSGVAIVQALDIVGKGHTNPSMQDLII